MKRKITSGTKEWADFNVNCVKGCSNDCRYCYAKMIAKRFGRKTEDSWKNMEINIKAVEKNYKKYNGRVMFPSSHDIVDDPEILDACFTVIRKLLETDNEVLITSNLRLDQERRKLILFGNPTPHATEREKRHFNLLIHRDSKPVYR